MLPPFWEPFGITFHVFEWLILDVFFDAVFIDFWSKWLPKANHAPPPPFSSPFQTCSAGGDLCWFDVDLLRSALARRPAYTLRMYTLIRMLAPCLASALSRYHPGWDPTPRTPPPGTLGCKSFLFPLIFWPLLILNGFWLPFGGPFLMIF